MSKIQITALSEPHSFGHGPIWIEIDEAVMYVDAFQGVVHRHFPETGRHQTLCIEKVVGDSFVTIVIPVEGEPDLYLVTVGRFFGTVRWPVSSPDQLTVKADLLDVTDDHDPLNQNHFNDGKCDPRGRLWAGAKSLEKVDTLIDLKTIRLYCLDSQLKLTSTGENKTSLIKGFAWTHEYKDEPISNGLAWSHDRKTFYYIDSPLQLIYAFDYDDNEGKISNRRVMLDFKSKAELSSSYPHGMTIDNNGNLWVACFAGKKVICVDPSKEGDILHSIEMPCHNVTSVAFGGPGYATLYVTSGARHWSEEYLVYGIETPQAGCTFAVTGLGIQGSPPISYKADLEKLKVKQHIG